MEQETFSQPIKRSYSEEQAALLLIGNPIIQEEKESWTRKKKIFFIIYTLLFIITTGSGYCFRSCSKTILFGSCLEGKNVERGAYWFFESVTIAMAGLCMSSIVGEPITLNGKSKRMKCSYCKWSKCKNSKCKCLCTAFTKKSFHCFLGILLYICFFISILLQALFYFKQFSKDKAFQSFSSFMIADLISTIEFFVSMIPSKHSNSGFRLLILISGQLLYRLLSIPVQIFLWFQYFSHSNPHEIITKNIYTISTVLPFSIILPYIIFCLLKIIKFLFCKKKKSRIDISNRSSNSIPNV